MDSCLSFFSLWYQGLSPELIGYGYRRGCSLWDPFIGVLVYGKSTEAGFIEVNLNHWEGLLKLLSIQVLVVCLEAELYDRLFQMILYNFSTFVFFD